jgi:capsular polysaccharide transport system permease protein
MAAAPRRLRTPLEVTLAVWRALFLREAVARVSKERLAWLWLLLEPIGHIAILVVIRVVIRQRVIAGADAVLFYVLGVLAFFMPRNMILRSFDAVAQSSQLYAHRQIKPVDAVLVRAAIEGLVSALLFAIMLGGLALLGTDVAPDDPMRVLAALGALWLAGLGLGLINSVIGELLPDVGRMLRVLLTPLYILSGVMYPTVIVPHPLRDWLLYNPLLHAVEALRAAWMRGYRVPAEISLSYTMAFAIVAVFLGLALQVRFRTRLIAQ